MEKFLDQIWSALQTCYGWFIAAIVSTITFIQPEKISFIVVGAVVLADLIWGIAASLKLKKFLLSKALRETMKKVGIYSFSLLSIYAVEWIIHTEGSFIALRTAATFAAVCEVWSMSASMLIIKPDMPFLRLFRGQLKGEIQSKLNKNINLDEILKDDEDTN